MRIKWIDQYKGFLGLLVIVGHMANWSKLNIQVQLIDYIYYIINTFHMPAFFIVSGYLGIEIFAWQKILKRTFNLVVPLAAFGVVYFLILDFSGYYNVITAMVTVLNNYWFIFVLVFATILYPLVHKVRHPIYRVVLLLFLSILFVNVNYKISMIIQYLLCYAVGVLLRRVNIQSLSASKTGIALLILACIASLIYLYFHKSVDIYEHIHFKTYQRIFLGIGCSICVMRFFSKLKPTNLFVSAGKVTLEMYLLQFVLFFLTKHIIAADNVLISAVSFVVMTTVSFLLPIWVYKHFKDTTAYRLIFSPYQYIEKYLPSMRIKA